MVVWGSLFKQPVKWKVRPKAVLFFFVGHGTFIFPETNIFAPEIGWLGDRSFHFGIWPMFRGENVSFREGRETFQNILMDCIYSNLFIIINDYITLKYNDDIEYIEDFYNIPYLIFISVVFVEICKMMTLQYTKVAKANLVFSSRLIIYLHKIHFSINM